MGEPIADAAGQRISLLDVGDIKYADSVLCQLGGATVLIDGGHPGDDVPRNGHESIPDQLRTLTGTRQGSIAIDLLVVTHLHDDHIGCLPDLVGNRVIQCANALVLDPKWRWDQAPDAAAFDAVEIGARQVALALGEEPRSPAQTDAQLLAFLADAAVFGRFGSEVVLVQSGFKAPFDVEIGAGPAVGPITLNIVLETWPSGLKAGEHNADPGA